MLSSTVSKLSGFTSTNLRSFSFGSGSSGWPVKSQYTHDERQFFHFDGVADFHVVRDLDPRRADSIQFVLRAFSCHWALRYLVP